MVDLQERNKEERKGNCGRSRLGSRGVGKNTTPRAKEKAGQEPRTRLLPRE